MTSEQRAPLPGGPDDEEVPRAVRVAAAWAWRLLVVAAAVVAVVLMVNRLKPLFLSLFIALLFAALLSPAVRAVQRLVRSRGAATAIVLVGGLVLLVAVGSFLAIQISGQVKDLGTTFSDGVDQIRRYVESTLGISDSTLNGYIDQIRQSLAKNRDSLVAGAVSGAAIAVEVVTGAFIALFATIFFLLDGDRIWQWVVSLFPRRAQHGVDEAGSLSWVVLTGYVRGTMIIAFTDALFIGIAIAIIGVPLALPLAVLVFFGAFIPIVGALISGFVAVAVALAANGPVAALLVLASILAVQQIEGHILQPLVMGRFVSVHPLGVIFAVTAGTILAGLVGAVVAVPIAAVGTTVFGYYGRRARQREDGQDPDSPPTLDDAAPVEPDAAPVEP
jgi:predicted PurR-regulated permease PerM